jgi:large conductance mechanosensitive channel
MIEEFKKFIARGNMLDLAVGIVIGAAFSGLVASLVNDIIMPPIGLLMGGVDFSNLYINLSGGTYDSLEAARTAGAVVIAWGQFINNVINFLIVAFIIFLIVRAYNKMNEMGKKPAPAAEATTRACPQCDMVISVKAKRCPHCTSQLEMV